MMATDGGTSGHDYRLAVTAGLLLLLGCVVGECVCVCVILAFCVIAYISGKLY